MAEGDIFRIVVVFGNTVSNEECSITLSGIQEGLIAPSMSAMGDDVKAWWDTDLAGGTSKEKGRHAAAITLERVTLRRIKPLEPLEQQYLTGLPIAGAALGDPLPPATATLISLRTVKIGKSYRGRVYLPPFDEGQGGVTGELSQLQADLVHDQWQAFLDSLATDAFVPAVYSRKLDTADEIVLSKVDRRYRSQRRRADSSPLYAT